MKKQLFIFLVVLISQTCNTIKSDSNSISLDGISIDPICQRCTIEQNSSNSYTLSCNCSYDPDILSLQLTSQDIENLRYTINEIHFNDFNINLNNDVHFNTIQYVLDGEDENGYVSGYGHLVLNNKLTPSMMKQLTQCSVYIPGHYTESCVQCETICAGDSVIVKCACDPSYSDSLVVLSRKEIAGLDGRQRGLENINGELKINDNEPTISIQCINNKCTTYKEWN